MNEWLCCIVELYSVCSIFDMICKLKNLKIVNGKGF